MNIRDADNHLILRPAGRVAPHEVHIGAHVWLCSHVDIIKGWVPDHSIVGYRSLVNKEFRDMSHVLLTGCPARLCEENVDWQG